MSGQYVKFRIAGEQNFEAVEHIIQAFIAEAQGAPQRSDEDWLALFGDESKAYFWWPTPQEEDEWKATWFGTPYQQRHLLLPTRWDFGSLIETVKNNEWELLGVSRSDDGTAIISFVSHAYPFGGTGCLVAIAEALGHEVIERDDGTGLEHYKTITEYWASAHGKTSPEKPWWKFWR
ncbi:MAG TPA: hypothetical protein VLI06_11140 [Solimonas sp.]|nr:hypothetical protein [Solimonas sp.]